MSAQPEVQVYADAPALMQAAAEEVVTLATAAIAAHGRFSVALSGGSTPKALYALLAEPPFAGQVDWTRAHVFWGDERTVPPDHADSNYRMAHEAWLGHSGILPEHVYRIHGELDPAQAAADYENVLRTFFGADALPRFDLVLLGLGDDGHTASLFPGTAVVHEAARWVVAHYVPKLDTWRITLTPPVLNAAATVAFLVSGSKKAARLQEVLRGPYQPDVLPSQVIRPGDGRLLWLVDEAAAAAL